MVTYSYNQIKVMNNFNTLYISFLTKLNTITLQKKLKLDGKYNTHTSSNNLNWMSC